MMIGHILSETLKSKGMNVNELARGINISPQTLYSIIRRDSMKIDFEVLLKICDFLNVGVDHFYSAYLDKEPALVLSKDESTLVTSYRTLNKEGQDKINDYLDDIKTNSKYKKFDELDQYKIK